MKNELERRAGDIGWIVSADAICPELTSLKGVTAALRFEARDALADAVVHPGWAFESTGSTLHGPLTQ